MLRDMGLVPEGRYDGLREEGWARAEAGLEGFVEYSKQAIVTPYD